MASVKIITSNCAGDGGFSGSEFFPGKFTAVEFFDEGSPNKSQPKGAEKSPAFSTFKPSAPQPFNPNVNPPDDDTKKDGDGASSSSPESTSPSPKESPEKDLHSMWLREGKLPDRSGLRLEFRPPPLGAESCEVVLDVSDSLACDKVLSKGEARVLD